MMMQTLVMTCLLTNKLVQMVWLTSHLLLEPPKASSHRCLISLFCSAIFARQTIEQTDTLGSKISTAVDITAIDKDTGADTSMNSGYDIDADNHLILTLILTMTLARLILLMQKMLAM
jgi:hypothetical protein